MERKSSGKRISLDQPKDASSKPVNAFMSYVNAARVIPVLEKAIERLQLLALLNYESFPNSTDQYVEIKSEAGLQPDTHNTAEVRGVLDEQKRLEQRYEELLIATSKRKNNIMDPVLDAVTYASVDNVVERQQKQELIRISKQLKELSKQLTRQLKENPNDNDNWKKVVNERGELTNSLVSCVHEMTNSMMASNLSTTNASSLSGTMAMLPGDPSGGGGGVPGASAAGGGGGSAGVGAAAGGAGATPSLAALPTGLGNSTPAPSLQPADALSGKGFRAASSGNVVTRAEVSYEQFAHKILDEQNEKVWADEIVKREKETNMNVKHLQNEVTQERMLKEKEIEERQAKLSDLKMRVRRQKQETKESTEKRKAEEEAKAEARGREANNRKRELREKLDVLQKKLEIENDVNASICRHLNKKMDELLAKTGDWTFRQGEDNKSLDDQLSHETRLHDEQKEKLKVAEEKHTTESDLKRDRETDEARTKQQKQKWEDIQKSEFAAATKLQAAVKGYLARRDAELKKKKGKKKGKK